MDPLSKALRRGIESFLQSLEAEFRRREALQTLLQDSIEASVSAFVNAESVQEALAKPFRNPDSFDVAALAGLWREIPGPEESGKLTELPPGFDWDAVGASYLQSVRTLLAETPQLREIWIANNVEAVKCGVEAMRGVAPRFSLDSYRQVLMEEFGRLKLSAIHVDCDQDYCDRGVSLQNVYVQQRVKESFPPRDLSRDYSRKQLAIFPSDSGESTSEDRGGIYRRAPTRRFDEILSDPSCQRVVVLGSPGSGKSTLLQHLALDWAQGVSTAVPFLIELRKYTRDRVQPRSFLEFLESGTWSHCHLPQGELDRYLQEREVTVMFDGLDEIFDKALRSNIVSEIISFGRTYPSVKVIVTTRVAGYAAGSPNPDHFLAAGFRHFTLQDFDDTEIREFARRWYATTAPDASERETLTVRLTASVNDSSAIRELAGIPLLLTMMPLKEVVKMIFKVML
jgi:hypothetical protein